MANTKIHLYGARDTTSGKLVSDITNPGKKYWQRKSACKEAIDNYNSGRTYYGRSGNHGKLELVTFELVEVTDV